MRVFTSQIPKLKRMKVSENACRVKDANKCSEAEANQCWWLHACAALYVEQKAIVKLFGCALRVSVHNRA